MTRARPAMPAPNLRRAPLSRRLATAWTRYVDTLAEHGVESAHLWRLEERSTYIVPSVGDAVERGSETRATLDAYLAADARLEAAVAALTPSRRGDGSRATRRGRCLVVDITAGHRASAGLAASRC